MKCEEPSQCSTWGGFLIKETSKCNRKELLLSKHHYLLWKPSHLSLRLIACSFLRSLFIWATTTCPVPVSFTLHTIPWGRYFADEGTGAHIKKYANITLRIHGRIWLKHRVRLFEAHALLLHTASPLFIVLLGFPDARLVQPSPTSPSFHIEFLGCVGRDAGTVVLSLYS